MLKNEIPASQFDAVLAAQFRGLGLMEQFDYPTAAGAFREVHALAPGWIPGSINLAISLLNMTGEQIEESKKPGGAEVLGNFDAALKLLSDVLEREPATPMRISAWGSSSSSEAICRRPITTSGG